MLVSGLGGIGKSLLVEEYTLRFGTAFPGGVFWLRAFGNDPSRHSLTAEARETIRIEQFGAIAVALSASLAMSLPISTPPNAIAFSTRTVDTREMARTGTIVSSMGLIVVLILSLILISILD